jgi:hypothetical protein
MVSTIYLVVQRICTNTVNAMLIVGEEEEDGQDELSQSSQDEELGAEEVTSAPPDGYARRVFSYHVNGK